VVWLVAAIGAGIFFTLAFSPGELDEYTYPGLPNPLGVGGGVGDVLTATESIGSGILPIAVLVSISYSAIRFRRSSGRERLQFKWIVYTATLTAASFLVSFMQPARFSLWLRDRRRKEGRKAKAKCEKIP
jgi:hypothetical protein